jgi:glycosyltransferase involved in cell wall biosynthesis
MVAVGDLSASGGAERQFSDVFEYLRRTGAAHVTLITARASLVRLRRAGRLRNIDQVVALPLGASPARGALNVAWMTALLVWLTLVRRFDIVHLCLPTPSYVPFAGLLTRLPRAVRPRIVLNVIDCTLAYNLATGQAADIYEQQVLDAHRLYFRWARLDGIYTWYRAFADECRRRRLVASDVVIRAARFCFTDPQRFRPQAEKQNVVLFAGRLSAQKRPWLFVEAIALLRRRCPDLIRNWRFEMYGDGILRSRVAELIAAEGVGDIIAVTSTPDMAPVFARTRLFVSTQALENFTSLAMLEAMAAGNAVIAEDVGQTREFVIAGDNGLLVSPATGETFAQAIGEYLRHPEWHDRMAAASRQRATSVHTIEHFAEDITGFWQDVVSAD